MEIRWKSSLVCLFFSIAISLLYLARLDYLRYGGEEIFIYGLFVVSMILGTISFTISLAITDGMIKNKKFSYGKLIGINFLTFIMIAIALLFLSVLFADLYILFYIIYGPLISLFVTIVFSLIPAVIFHNIYGDEKLQKKIFYTFLILSTVLFISFFCLYFTCNFGTSADCLRDKALTNNNPSICEKGLYAPMVWACYSSLVDEDSSIINTDICSKLEGNKIAREACIMKIAIRIKDSSLCDGLTTKGYKEQCLKFS